MCMNKASELPIIAFSSKSAWVNWLDTHHSNSAGIWLKLAKKASGIESVTFLEALEVALCYGWIDSQGKTFDDKYYLQKFTPRGPKSVWSLINRDKVEKLIAGGKIKPSGLAAIEAAKADGRWDRAYASQSNSVVPDDFEKALNKNDEAKAYFESLSSANRYAFLYRLQQTKPEKRAAKIESFIEKLKNKQAFH
jgi:uncharacterized protein YdeI (YjbR/CyaY-like superfamily)